MSGYNLGLLHMIVQKNSLTMVCCFIFEISSLICRGCMYFGNTNAEIIGSHFFSLIPLIVLHFASEKINKEAFHQLFYSKETLLKFKEFLSKYLPSSLIILDKEKNILLKNHSFDLNFGQVEEFKSTPLKTLTTIKSECSTLITSEKQLEPKGEVSLLDIITSQIDFHKSIIEQNCIYIDPKSQKKTYEVKIFPIIWDLKDAIAVLLHDISHQEALLSLKIANENQEKAISTVAHELRNPVNGLLGITRMIESYMENRTSKCSKLIMVLKTNINLMLNILNSVLDIQQIRANKLVMNIERVNVEELINNISMLYEFQFEKSNLQLICDIDPAVPTYIFTDKNRLSQILINLMGNALKFTKQGSISLIVMKDPEDPRKIMFKVRDTGIGIKPEECGKLFQLFGKLQSSLSLNHQGVGLGLVISNSLVKALNRNEENCHIKVESTYQQGSTFYFSIYSDYNRCGTQQRLGLIEDTNFPTTQEISSFHYIPLFKPKTHVNSHQKLLDDDSSASPSDVHELYVDESLVKRTVLIVDDSYFNLMAAKQVLVSQGFKCFFAKNGKEAIEQVIKFHKQKIGLNLILMDCEMPIMDGFEASKQLNKLMDSGELDRIPILGLSGGSNEETDRKCQEAGMAGHIPKPLTKEEFFKAVQKLGHFDDDN